MGLFSSSKSSSTTRVYDNRVAASEQGLAIGQGATLNVTNDKAFDLGAKVVNTAEAWGDSAFSLALQSLQSGASAVNSASSAMASTAGKAIDFADKRSQSEVQNLVEIALRFGLPVVLIGLVAFAFIKR